MLEERVKALEAQGERVEAALRAIQGSLIEIKTELKSVPKASDFAEIKGQLSQMPKATDYASLKADIAEIKGRVSGLEGRLSMIPGTWQIIAILTAFGGILLAAIKVVK